jgi:hypothetical protein
VSAQHPADADRQMARDALASMPAPRRAFLEALHTEFFPPRADGGQPYPLAELLDHLAGAGRHGVGDDRLWRWRWACRPSTWRWCATP